MKWAGCWVFGPRVERKKKKKNKLGWAGKREMGEGWSDSLFFNSFSFISFSSFYSKPLQNF
jgi:hypothetical protein